MTSQRVADGRFVLVERLGAGGMGIVWRATDELLGRDVAVKQVQTHRAGRERLIREARAAARLNHPGAVTVHDVVSDGDDVFVVMELVAAPTLADLVVREGPLPSDRVARLGLCLLEVLEEAHHIGIVHRDVKPANVMVLAGDRVKLADFGIARISGDPSLTREGTVLGSPAYMSPEQARGRRVDPATDMWGLGATLYYAAEGEAAFGRETYEACIAAVMIDQPRPRKASADLAVLLTALLEKDPARRPVAGHIRETLWRIATLTPAPVAPPPAEDTTKGRPELWDSPDPALGGRNTGTPATTTGHDDPRPGPYPPPNGHGRSASRRRTLTIAAAAVVVSVLFAVPAWLVHRHSASGAGAAGRTSPAAPSTGTGTARPSARPSPSTGQSLQPTTRTVTYKIGGSADSTSITYSTPSGQEQANGAGVPWRKSFKARERGFDRSLFVAAQNQGGGGTITCEIDVDGVKVKSARSTGAYATATCQAPAPAEE